MNIRLFNSSDYETISSWWKQHEWPSIPLKFLPKIGIIVDECAAGFIYATDSKFCMLEFVVVNPNTEKSRRRMALDLMIQEAIKVSKEMGYDAIFTSVTHKGLLERYKNNGFCVTDKEMTHLIRMI